MPYIAVKTNVAVNDTSKLKAKLGKTITALGKTENWLMIEVCADLDMCFAGSDAPCAFADVSLLGAASSSQYSDMTKKVCDCLSSELDIPADRIYVKYEETKYWGWAGSNF